MNTAVLFSQQKEGGPASAPWHRVTVRAADGHVLDLAELCAPCWQRKAVAAVHTADAWIEVASFVPTAGAVEGQDVVRLAFFIRQGAQLFDAPGIRHEPRLTFSLRR